MEQIEESLVENENVAQFVCDSQSEEPKRGMRFHSEEEAYSFYNNYARKKGFSVRKDRINHRADGTITTRKFVCSYAGVRAKHRSHVTQKPHVNQRTECKCRVDLRISRDGVCEIYNIFNEHNHVLVSPNKTFMLRSHRKILPSTLDIMKQMDKAGIQPTKAYDFFVGGSSSMQNVGFLRMDHNNAIQKGKMRGFDRNDAQHLLDHFKRRQSVDPSFVYSILLNEEGQISNIFWADGKSILDYAFFGDVICFDTTFKTNKYDLPFAPLLGVNHHKQTVIFGAALLNDETTETFIWLFETFINLVSSLPPKTIFTDRCAAMARAISVVFPSTAHRLCLWHIFENAAKNLSHIFAANPSFARDFKCCIYEARSLELLHSAWDNLLSTYNLQENAWLKDLWEVREKWSAFYRAGSFCANMTTTQRSESMNNHFKKHFGRKLNFIKFIEEYEMALNKFREKELYEDHKSKNFSPVLRVASMPMLREASKAYTRAIYTDFEEECLSQISCLCELISVDNDTHIYKVCPPEECKIAYVTFNVINSSTECSCKKFESFGILCMHAMKILTHNRILTLQPKYILKRWCKSAKSGLPCDMDERHIDLSSQIARISRNSLALVSKCSTSRTAMDMLESELNRLSLQIDTILIENSSNAPSNVNEDINIRPPPTKVVGQKRRFKSALERATRKKSSSQKKNSVTSMSHVQTNVNEQQDCHEYNFMDLLSQVSQSTQELSSQDVSRRLHF